MMRIFALGVRRPRQTRVGLDFSGEIASVGEEVTGWKEGDHVYGFARGACAEYLRVPPSQFARKPTNMSFQEAGALPGAATVALVSLRDFARIQSGQRVLIIGASGGIGTYAVQIAKIYETEVTGVCGPSNLKMVRELGADSVIDYTKDDYTKNGQTYDIIFDVVGKNTFSRCKKSLAKEGVYVANYVFNSKKHLFHMLTSKFTSKKLKFGVANSRKGDLTLLREWIEEGKLKSVIDKVYPLGQTAEAHRHYETGHAKQRVVISID